ncbi:MAG: catalase HPII, partial [Devosia sp.]
DGADAELVKALEAAALSIPAVVEIIAPTVGGVTLSDGSRLVAQHKIDGGPSVLFDAVALVLSEEGADKLLRVPPARDFAADAYAHYKFIGFTEAALPLMQKAGLPPGPDAAMVPLKRPADAARFIKACAALRFWDRPDGA